MSKALSITEGLKEVERFFQGKNQVHKTLRRTVKRLERAGIAYAVLGGMALNAHRYRRVTTDLDILLTPDGLKEFRDRFVGKHYDRTRRRPRRFVDRLKGVQIDILLTGHYPGTGSPGPIAFPHPREVGKEIEDISYVNLPTLVQLKLAARRWRDFADVVELIRHNRLDESFVGRLHSSVRQDYIECLEEKRREDLYRGRHGF
jgi:hypothetical protein